MGRFLSIEDLKWAAEEIGCELAVIRAVDQVESRGKGFNEDGSPTILFEGHKFHKYTDGKYSDIKEYEDISYPRWTKKWYATGRTRGIRQQGEYDRLQRAVELDKEAALLSTSWGRYQIMGFNYEMVGFDDVFSFFYAMGTSEFEHLKAFIKFVKHNNIDDDLRRKDWEGFAYRYNGSGYKKWGYHTKLKKAYEQFS